MPENLWIEVGVLCKTMKEKRSIIEDLKQHFNVEVHPIGRNSKRRWLEATVYMENMQETEATNKISGLFKETKAEGWLDVWVHSFSHHVTPKMVDVHDVEKWPWIECTKHCMGQRADPELLKKGNFTCGVCGAKMVVFSPTNEERRITEKALAGNENLTWAEYRVFEGLADKLNLEHDLPLKEAAQRILDHF